MIDNFELINPLLDYPNTDTFYFLQIIKRRKDNPDLEKSERIIRNYYLYGSNELMDLKPRILEHCEDNNARAYIRLNKRSAKKCALQSLKRITDLIISENYKDVRNIYDSIAGEFHADEDKKWLLDIDAEPVSKGFDADLKIQLDLIDKLKAWRFKNNPNQEHEDKIDIVTEIPSVSGMHIICRPFRLDLFKKAFPGMDAHKDNPTILYFAGKNN